jgi:hypothetical protein
VALALNAPLADLGRELTQRTLVDAVAGHQQADRGLSEHLLERRSNLACGMTFCSSEKEDAGMPLLLKVGRVIALGALLGTPAALAGPTPVLTAPLDSPYQLARQQNHSAQSQSAKTWFKTKKDQTASWMKRQKRKLKRAVD